VKERTIRAAVVAEPAGPGQTSGMTGISEAAGTTDSRPDREIEISRPWGGFTVLDDAPDHKVKRLVVLAGHRLSYQRHAHRAEHWFVIRGSGHVTLDGVDLPVEAGTAIDVPRGAAHRITNTGDADLVFVEVQHGDSFAEEDIERLEDDYGRSN
jgi:mannose-6-phosphate isomerase